MKRHLAVSIRFGPFIGFEGVVVSTQPERVLVRITFKDRPILVELDRSMVEDARKARATTSNASRSFR